MPRFSNRSLRHLSECHPDLQRVAHEAIKYFDFTVYEGYRGPREQMQYLAEGKSRAQFGQSPHNYSPALAFDCFPYTGPGRVQWDNAPLWEDLANAMFLAADAVGVGIEWGGDWTTFVDKPHFQLKNWRNYA